MSPAPRLRAATLGDGPVLLDWRNDPLTRAASLDPRPIGRGAHLSWFAAALADPARQILIAELAGDPAGMVRFDLEKARGGPCTVWVSIMLAPRARGFGHGGPILAAAMPACRFRGKPLRARIRRGNAASLSLFRAAGFEAGPDDGTDILTLTKEPTMTETSKYDAIIDEIEAVRSRNNKNWMDILRLAFRHSPQDAAAILREIYKEDKAISDLAAKLTE
ncbi:GNAT family N-acetyltransferase [Profundibacterium mesophilum]|uniref:Phospholipiddiacylglycerol acyltransferase n=1 Tax=Profundibacterium mesophilum KAUST100406-0324 TaxID=1037889 RepID=A0A921P0M6_9RHOB|nr:GNAT family N-acetyltransferase [Profundibacterium mesophilum]KAF0677018.1 phospholipiddiacylglycerol acyltransferase [Profundibacterium mesophilum KAUST100406-0324]